MMNYYSSITLIAILALIVLCVLVHNNSSIPKKQKTAFYLTYLLIGLAASAEWAGIQLSGNPLTPKWLLISVKCIDYVLTPAAGGALIRQLNIKNRGITILNALLIGNCVFQIISCFFGWMIVINEKNEYSHGPLYFVYAILYMSVIAVVIAEFLLYGKNFKKQNRYSLYSVMFLILIGILAQELLGKDFRTAYITLTLGASMLFIHYIEFEQINAKDSMNRQKELLYKDVMTGLYSRYAYSEDIKNYDNQKDFKNDLIIFSVDINGLKSVNDSSGHAAGDELICGAAECISKVFASYGKCYRTGGDEFIIFAHGDIDTAEKLIMELTHEANRWRGKLIPSLSLSAGYALSSTYPEADMEKLIVQADKSMYLDKKNCYRHLKNRNYDFCSCPDQGE